MKARSLGGSLGFFLWLIGISSDVCALDLDPNSKLSIQNEFLYSENHVTGSNPSGSFLTRSRRGLSTENLSLLYNHAAQDVSWEAAADGRATDDPRIEAKHFNLKRFYIKRAARESEAVAGDYLASFSPYSLNTSLKGGRYLHRINDKTDLTFITGIAKVNWDDLWNNNATETVDRKFYGGRLARRFSDEGALGANVVWSNDSRSRFNTTAVLQNQRIFSADWSLPSLHRLWLHGESAFSKTENDNPTSAATSQQGWAHLVKADYSLKRFKTQNDFERVSPNYATTGGSASPDLIRGRTQNQYRFVGPWRLIFNYSWFHNNLNHAAGGVTSTTRLPEGGLRYDGPDWRPSFSAESKLRYREVTASDTGLRDRTRSISANLSDRLGPVNANVDYEFQHQDKSDGTQSGRHHILGVGLNGMFPFGSGFKVMPSLRWNLQRDRDNLIAKADQTTIATANLAVQTPWDIDGGLGYSRNLVANAVNPGADRRSLTASAGYNILHHKEHRLELRFKQNDNRFTAAAQDFKEMVWEFALSSRF